MNNEHDRDPLPTITFVPHTTPLHERPDPPIGPNLQNKTSLASVSLSLNLYGLPLPGAALVESG